MRKLTPIDNQLLRKATMRYLAMHHPAGFTIETLCATVYNRGLIDFQPTKDELKSALLVLLDLGLVASIPDPLGASTYYKCTGKGKIEEEREEQETE